MNKLKAIFNKNKKTHHNSILSSKKDNNISQLNKPVQENCEVDSIPSLNSSVDSNSILDPINNNEMGTNSTDIRTSTNNNNYHTQTENLLDREKHNHSPCSDNSPMCDQSISSSDISSPQLSTLSNSNEDSNQVQHFENELINTGDPPQYTKEVKQDHSNHIPSRFKEQSELNDYKLIDKIGEGAFSKVFKAEPLSTANIVARNYENVAIKIIKKESLTPSTSIINKPKIGVSSQDKTSSIEQVLKEVTLHKLISSSCPNVVVFIDFIETRSYYYIIQELLNGGEVFNAIVKFTYFSEDLSRHIIKQLGEAVQAMHKIGIVHRDIKPENLLYEPIEYIPNPNPQLRKSDDPNTKLDEGIFIPNIGGGGIGQVKLTDFGLSKQIYQTNTKTPCGTVGYTAPEVVKDQRYSMKVDMWGIGCVLYTMLCGFPPFYDDKIDILTRKISVGEYSFLKPWWDEISEGAKNCVRKLLEVDPEKRYTIEQFLNDPWLNTFDTQVDDEIKDDQDVTHNLEKRENKGLRKSNTFKRKMISMYNNEQSSLLCSPAAVAMRDAFDISNAVKRNEVQSPRIDDDLFSLEEENETEGDDNSTTNKPLSRSISPARFNYKDDTSKFNRRINETQLDVKLFELTLNSSSILQRRQKKLRITSPLAQN